MEIIGFGEGYWEPSDGMKELETIWNAEAIKIWPEKDDRMNAMKDIAKEIDKAMRFRLDNMYHSRII